MAGPNVSKSSSLSIVKKVHFKMSCSIFNFKPRLCEKYIRYQRPFQFGNLMIWAMENESYSQNLTFYEELTLKKEDFGYARHIDRPIYASSKC